MIYVKKISLKDTLLTSIILPFFAVAQLSPGDLAEAHAHLEGLSNCTQCHVLNQKVSNEKCLACHDLLNDRITQGKGFHASTEIAGKECITCHSDHHGRKFQMIRFDTVKFNHNLTGYDLLGAHAKLSCTQCHQSSFIPEPEIRKLKRTYLGLETTCLNCHNDHHEKTLSANCMECHSFESFKQVPNFNHNNSAFPLVGKHMDVSCEKCHFTELRNGRDFQVFKGLKFANCTDCHKDVHDNKFGQDCKRCHTEKSFHAIIGITSFDHSRTGYALEGLHKNIACEKCHPVNYTNPVRHNLCMDCHDDYHDGQFRNNGNQPDCVNCHSVNGFKPTLFTVEEHQKGAFPLEGAHLATPCFICHKNADKWQFRQIGIECADCHQDIHQPYLKSKYYPDQDCKSCHSLESWKQIGFDHGKTDYPLTGKHRGPSCRACHQNNTTDEKTILRFSGISDKCVNCHQDNHAGQFETGGAIDCARCHDNNGWKIDPFNHDKTRFALDGRHDQLICAACHKPASINGINTIQYKFEDIRCESCH